MNLLVSNPHFYPIGTPGQPWGAAERAAWRARQVKQRSYADDVLTAIDRLRALQERRRRLERNP